MTRARDVLRTKAFRTGAGPEYNAVSQALRQEAADVPVVFYELVLPTDERDAWAWLCAVAVPRFVAYLGHKRLAPETADGVIVSVFDGDAFLLVRGPAFLACYREHEGIDDEEFRTRVRGWLSAGGRAVSGLPAALPAAPAEDEQA